MTHIVTRLARPLFAFALLTTSLVATATDPSQWIEKAISALPVPGPEEFTTPESVVRAYLQAVDRNDVDDGMKCFPIREYYVHGTWDVEADFTGAILGKRAFPGSEVIQFRRALEYYASPWWVLERIRVQQADPDDAALGAMLPLAPGIEKRKAQLAAFDQTFRKARAIPIEVRAVKAYPGSAPGVLNRALGAESQTAVDADVKVGSLSMKLTFMAIKVGRNWRIHAVFGPEKYLRYP